MSFERARRRAAKGLICAGLIAAAVTVLAQPVAVKWTEQQQIVWPTDKHRVEGMKFSTEQFVDAVIEDAFDTHRTCNELAEIDPGLSLEERLCAAVVILQDRLRRVVTLFGSLRLRREAHDHDRFRAKQQADNELLNSAIALLIEPDRDRLRLDVMEAASALRTITFSITHPILGDQRLAQPRQIVDLVLYGIRRRPGPG